MHVAAAVILRPDGQFLLAQRPAGKVYAGYWEFPGGKVEPGESARAALKRELHEELGIDVDRAYRWITRDYDYPHASVRLHFYRVVEWHGTPHGKEAQCFAWQSSGSLSVKPLLPANGPVMRALRLPMVYGISNAADLGSEGFVAALERALDAGLRLFQLREQQLSKADFRALAVRSIEVARRHQAQVLINGDVGLAAELGADGVHLRAAQLAELSSRPQVPLVGASCHNAAELERAVRLGADFVVLGPVLRTPSHPEHACIGWRHFSDLIRDYPLPVFALGGMGPGHLNAAWRAGAHGIGMLRGAWCGKAALAT